VRKILIIGAGGIGSYLIQYLYKTGLYKIDVYDPDKVEKKNITYQNFDRDDIGLHKVVVMQKNYAVKAEPYPILTESQLGGYQLVICCADNLGIRKTLYRSKVKWLDLRAQGRNCAMISYKMDKNKFDTVLAGPDGSFSCQGEWNGKAKNIHMMNIVAAGMGAQWIQRWFNKEDVCDSKVINI
jgi:molybdopterin/thiamine biosynthesis adenylyltransferase